MLGAIAGDIIGSPHEFESMKSLDFPLFGARSRFTDDSVLTAATAFTLMTDGDYAANYRLFGRLYPLAGYGGRFGEWLAGEDASPYGSYGNGSGMRVSPVGFALDEEEDVLAEAERSAAVTHDHPEGIKGAQAVALAVFLARKGADAETLRSELTTRFGYDLARTPDEIRPAYAFDETCQGSVPEALTCALAGAGWEECVRLAVSLGGDADTLGCMAGAVAEARFGGVPAGVDEQARALLPAHLLDIVQDFEERYGANRAR